jgi:hypothetical protein
MATVRPVLMVRSAEAPPTAGLKLADVSEPDARLYSTGVGGSFNGKPSPVGNCATTT